MEGEGGGGKGREEGEEGAGLSSGHTNGICLALAWSTVPAVT